MLSFITWNILIPIFSEEQFQKATLKPFLNSNKPFTLVFNYRISVKGKVWGTGMKERRPVDLILLGVFLY